MIAGRFRNFCRGLLALITLAAMTVGLPVALYEFGGSPIPSRVPSVHQITFALMHRDSGSLFVGAVRDVSWLAWLAFAVAVVAEAQAAVRGRRAPKLRLSVLQGMAGRLVALAALTFTTPAAVTLASSSAMASTVQSVAPAAKPGLAAHAATAVEQEAPARAVVVRPGDCLWTIAEHYLGNGDRYPEIVRLNIGHEMDGGRVFSDPSIILPGWHLAMPAVAAPGSAPHEGSGQRGGHSPGGAHHEGHPSAHSRFSVPHHGAPHHGAGHHGAGHHGAGHSAGDASGAHGTQGTERGTQGTEGTREPGGGGGSQAAGPTTPGASTSNEHDQVAEAALFALGMLAGAALASIDRLRHRQRQFRRPGRRIALPADPASRRIEQKLRAAAAQWPFSRTADEPDDWTDSAAQASRPVWPERPMTDGLGDGLGPAGNKLPSVGYEPPDPFDPAGDLEPPGSYESLDYESSQPPDGYDDPDDEPPGGGYDPAGGYQTDQTRPPVSSEPARVRGIPESLRDALRDLSEGIAVGGEPLPPIVGIHLTADTLDVLLSAPAATPPPAPFVIAPARQAMCWTVKLGGDRSTGTAPPVPGEVGDLLPGLFTAGATGGGGYLLLDLEAMRVTCCDGPDDLIDRLLVTAATELASSHWSGWYELVLAGCDELEVLGRAELCRDLDEAIDLLDARVQAISRRMYDNGPPDVRTRRLADPDDEDWGLTLLVSRLRPTPSQMARLLELADGPGGIAVLVAGDTQSQDGKLAPAVFELAADPDRPDDIVATITLAYLGPNHQIKVWPQTLTVPEYEALAGVLATAADTADVGVDDEPYNDFGAPPWIRLSAAPVAPLEAEADAFASPFGQYAPGGLGQRGQGLDGPDGAFGCPSPEMMQSVGWDAQLRPDDQPASAPRPHGARPRHAAPSLRVKVLGPVEITGAAEQLLPKQAELLLALALHAPVGVSNSGLCSLLGPDADHPRPADSVRQLITRTRKRLGQARDGQEYIIHLGSGIYVPHGDLSLDWAVFSGLARRGRAERRSDDLRAAMALVRGEPFADCYHWWIDVGLIETIRAEIVDTAELLAQLELAAGDPRAAAQAARAGLSAETAAEQLWRMLMRAEYEAGNPEGVTAAWTGCLDAISEIAPGGEPHPDTEQLFHQLTRAAPIASR